MSERHEFQAEVKQLLDLMVHSLYSDKDIFLRELISNASDAIDKLRFEQLTRPELAAGEAEIRLETDAEKRTLTIHDTGIGMTRDEVIKNIGTIAKSGTREFLTRVDKTKNPLELIGQFGVGFYSAFMVAERIELVTRKAGEAEATRWESTGDGSYTLDVAERAQAGTSITLHLKPADAEQHVKDYADNSVLADIVKRYSDFISYPVKAGDKTLNSMKAIWDRPKSEVSEDEYKEFYRHLTHDWTDPLRTLPVRMEGTIEAYALLYIPATAPWDLYSAEMKRGLALYVKRVFVMDECRDLMPVHLRFVRGVVDAHDLSLNVSREILQKDRQIALIKKQLVKKVLGALEEMKRDKPEDYASFWAQFGPVLKEGFLAQDSDKDKLLDLVVSASTNTDAALVSFDTYVGRMKEGQDAIYVLTGSSKETLLKSPLLEQFAQRGYEVLLFSDPIDELWIEQSPTYKDKPIKSIARGDIKLGTEEERKQASEQLETKQKELSDLLSCLRVHLQEHVKEVRLSNRMTASLACIVADDHDLSPRVQRMMEQLGQHVPKAKPILELNPDHAVVKKLEKVFVASHSDPRLALYARLLFDQAHLAEAGQVLDPPAFARSIAELMERALP